VCFRKRLLNHEAITHESYHATRAILSSKMAGRRDETEYYLGLEEWIATTLGRISADIHWQLKRMGFKVETT